MRNKRRLLACAVALLTGCGGGGDSPEQLATALGNAAPTLEFVDEEQSSCAGDALLSVIGFEQLSQDGVSSTALVEDPELIHTTFARHDSDELREGLTACFDTDSLVKARLATQLGVEELDCDGRFASSGPLAEQALDQHFAATSSTVDVADVDIADDEATRDLLRPCLDERVFAPLFGVDLAADLGPAISAGFDDRLAVLPCAGPAIVEQFGTEQLNSLGVSVETPEIDLKAMGFDAADEDDVISAVLECSEIRQLRRQSLRSDEPSLADCAMDALDGEWAEEEIRQKLGVGSRSPAFWLIDDALNDCAVERAESVVGVELTLPDRTFAQAQASFFENRIDPPPYGATQRMVDCAFYVATLTEGRDHVESVVDNLFSAATEQDASIAAPEAVRLLLSGRRACEGDKIFGFVEMYRAGFSTETADCVWVELGGTDTLAVLYEAVLFNPDASLAERQLLGDTWHQGLEGLRTCHSDDERGVLRAFESYYNDATTNDDDVESF